VTNASGYVKTVFGDVQPQQIRAKRFARAFAQLFREFHGGV
jgi:hypothetical protein